MKAILHTSYGPPDELQLGEVDKPIPKDNKVLIKIFATTVTTSDCNSRNMTFVPKLFVLPTRAEAFRYVESGHKKGNVVIIVEHEGGN